MIDDEQYVYHNQTYTYTFDIDIRRSCVQGRQMLMINILNLIQLLSSIIVVVVVVRIEEEEK